MEEARIIEFIAWRRAFKDSHQTKNIHIRLVLSGKYRFFCKKFGNVTLIT